MIRAAAVGGGEAAVGVDRRRLVSRLKPTRSATTDHRGRRHGPVASRPLGLAAQSPRRHGRRATARRPQTDQREDHRVGEGVVVVVRQARDDGREAGRDERQEPGRPEQPEAKPACRLPFAERAGRAQPRRRSRSTATVAIRAAIGASVSRPVSGQETTRTAMIRKRADGPVAAGSPPDRQVVERGGDLGEVVRQLVDGKRQEAQDDDRQPAEPEPHRPADARRRTAASARRRPGAPRRSAAS